MVLIFSDYLDNYKCDCGPGYTLLPNGYQCIQTPCRDDEFFCKVHDSAPKSGNYLVVSCEYQMK